MSAKDFLSAFNSVERTLLDVIRLRHREGIDVAWEALRRWVSRGSKPTSLLAMAKHSRRGESCARRKRADFVSLTMPVREAPWRWPRDLHPFFRQNLPEGYLLGVIREEFGRYLDGTDLSLLDPEPPEPAQVMGRSEGLAPRSKRRNKKSAG